MRVIATLCLALALLGCSEKPTSSAPQASGGLAGLEGQWVVINYWAKWCKPCAEEIPELNKLHTTYPEVTVVGVNFDGVTGEELAQQASELGIVFDNLAEDPSASLGIPRPVVLPTTLVLSPEGAVASTLIGPQTFEGLARVTTQIAPIE